MNNEDIPQIVGELYSTGVALEVLPTGSRFTCQPPVMTTDIDFAVCVGELSAIKEFKALGYDHGIEQVNDYPDEDARSFHSLRRDNVNLIVMTAQRYRLFKASTFIATKLNLLKKADRVTVFATLRDILLKD